MRYAIALIVALSASMPLLASASTVDATLVPDGTYTVRVEKIDAQKMTIVMDNGVETTVTATGSVDFSKLHAAETVKISMVKGKVPVLAVITTIK